MARPFRWCILFLTVAGLSPWWGGACNQRYDRSWAAAARSVPSGGRRAEPALVHSTSIASGPAASAASPPGTLGQIAYRLHQVHQHFRPPAPMGASPKGPCPDSLISQQTPELRDRTLVLRELDIRPEPRHLVPLRILKELQSRELAELGQYFGPEVDPTVPFATPTLADEQDGPRALEALSQLLHRRYLGVYYITDYRAAELVLKLGESHRKWQPGVLRVAFVIYDLARQEALCGFESSVENEIRDAPIRWRLRSETRAQLERSLARQAIFQARERLARITTALVWPAA